MRELSPRGAYLQLQRHARAEGRGTQELFELYLHERFLARLSHSPYKESFVLKGGMLLASLKARRPTRDADVLALDLPNDEESNRRAIQAITEVSLSDGVSFDPGSIRLETIRAGAGEPGLRASVAAGLSEARLKLKVDISFGDPVAPQAIEFPTLLDDEPLELLGYPVETVIAEKAETMMALGDANTRDRDFADIFVLSRVHSFNARKLRESLYKVARHREREPRLLSSVLHRLPIERQRSWRAFRERSGLSFLPEDFAEVVSEVIAFVDPVVADKGLTAWDPAARRWI